MTEKLTYEQQEKALKALIFSSMYFDENKMPTLNYGAYRLTIALDLDANYSIKWMVKEFYKRIARTFKDE